MRIQRIHRVHRSMRSPFLAGDAMTRAILPNRPTMWDNGINEGPGALELHTPTGVKAVRAMPFAL
ncbi:MAG: hypothetical protein AMXMBFR82_21760 [Candidatus Hydrogenedentota bacterium]